MRISDWSSDVCSSDLEGRGLVVVLLGQQRAGDVDEAPARPYRPGSGTQQVALRGLVALQVGGGQAPARIGMAPPGTAAAAGRIDQHAVEGSLQLRSEEHTSELQSLMRISYAVFCLKKKNNTRPVHTDDR